VGFQDNFVKMRAATQAAFGTTVTYIPISVGLEPFETTLILENFTVDAMGAHIMRDTLTATLAHSSLVAGGLLSPVHASNSSDGDSVQFSGIDGLTETWTVVSCEPDIVMGIWALTMEKNVRIVP
jgi:hypothetical protein